MRSKPQKRCHLLNDLTAHPKSPTDGGSCHRVCDSNPPPGHGLPTLYLFPFAAWCRVLGSGCAGDRQPGHAGMLLGERRWVAALGAAQTKRGGRFPAAAGSNRHDNQQADYSITAFLLKNDIKPRDNTSSASRGAWFSKRRAMFNFLIYLVIMFANLVLDLFLLLLPLLLFYPRVLWNAEKVKSYLKCTVFLVAGKHAGAINTQCKSLTGMGGLWQMHIRESAGAMTNLAKCAKPAPGDLNRATHAAVSETELSLCAVHPFHT